MMYTRIVLSRPVPFSQFSCSLFETMEAPLHARTWCKEMPSEHFGRPIGLWGKVLVFFLTERHQCNKESFSFKRALKGGNARIVFLRSLARQLGAVT